MSVEVVEEFSVCVGSTGLAVVGFTGCGYDVSIAAVVRNERAFTFAAVKWEGEEGVGSRRVRSNCFHYADSFGRCVYTGWFVECLWL